MLILILVIKCRGVNNIDGVTNNEHVMS